LLKRWNTNETYKTGDPVTHSGIYYTSKGDSNAGNDPATDAGVNWAASSGNAITDYTKVDTQYLFTDGGVSPGLDVDATITGGVATSVGPTGSGATVIWADMDALPANATSIYVFYRMLSDSVASGLVTFDALAGAAQGTPSLGAKDRILRDSTTVAGIGDRMEASVVLSIPLDSAQVFDLFYTASNATASDHVMFLRGFGTNDGA